MQFFMAAALADRRLGLAQFTVAKVRDPLIRSLMQTVGMSVHPGGGGGGEGFSTPC